MRARSRLVVWAVVIVGLPFAAVIIWFCTAYGFLQTQQIRIKNEIRRLDPSHIQSNDSDGRERFLQTGVLVIRRDDFLSPMKIFARRMFYFRLSPRVTTDDTDGWVEQQIDGTWMIKIW